MDDKNITFEMPPIYEKHSLPVTVDFDPGTVPFADYNQESNNVTIDQSLIEATHEGTNTVRLTLTDALGNSKDYILQIKINFKKNFFDNNQTQVTETINTVVSDDSSTECPGYISTITSLGEVRI